MWESSGTSERKFVSFRTREDVPTTKARLWAELFSGSSRRRFVFVGGEVSTLQIKQNRDFCRQNNVVI